jgi:DNA polymerase III subunit gamma/tau
MPYEITAARKRPQSFEELAGQDFVSATLEASLASGHIAHAYLFSGPRGCGKTSTARILAKALNCEEGPSAKPCGHCRSCTEIARGASLDVIEIDGASNTSVDNVRQIKDEVLFPPNGGRYKIYIIDEVHMLSNSAFNALLKTIEEPPPYVVFIFATTELHKVPATIKSRCQQFAFRLFPVDLLKSLLSAAAAETGIEAEDEALLWIAKEAGGSLRDAYTLFDQVVSFSEGRVTAAKIRDKLGLVGLESMNGLFECFVADDEGRTGRALEALDAILTRGVSPEQVVLDAAEYSRSLLLLKNGIDRESLLGASPSSYSATVLGALRPEQIEAALGLLLNLHRDIRFTVDPRFELELAMARLSHIRDYVSPAELTRAVAGIKRRLAGGAPVAAVETQSPESSPAPERSASEELAPAAQEKKKPELPSSLKSAFTSLAATFNVDPTAPDPVAVSHAMAPRAEPKSELKPEKTPPVSAASMPAPTTAPASSLLAEASAPALPGEAEDELEDGADGWAPDNEPVPNNASIAPANAPATAPATAGELRASVVAAVGKTSPLLKSGLASSLEWRLEADRLIIPFKNGMEESLVRGELPTVSQAVAHAAGRSIKVDLRVERQTESSGGSGPVASIPVEVAVVERVFRGQLIPEKAPKKTDGGNDGF